MATSNREVELGLRVRTSGTDDVQELAGGVRNLAAEAGKLDGAFAGTAADLAALSAQTRAFRDAEQSATVAVKSARQAINEQRDTLDRLKATYQATGGDTAAYRQQLGQMRLALVEAKIELRAKQQALQSAAAQARAAATAERALADQVRATAEQQAAAARKSGDNLQGLRTQLQQIQVLAAGVLGGQVLGGAIGEIGRTADAYSNLAARMRIVTGEGGAFKEAFEGVQAIAQRTGTSLESTATLFTRIAQAGKAMGLANADVLALTETINQAVQLSGASAQSSDAALTQLIQGLQSGVLRAEEFNSVAEQSPRLLQAMAAGLGVTTGELRAMAQAGKLTSETVIGSLRGQAQVLRDEFAQLPPTLGRALTNLSSAWTQYVGEVDQANGITATAAAAIGALARNLDTVGALLLSAGKAAAVYRAVGLAQTFLAQSAAVTAQTTTIAANTAATAANTAAKRANAAANVAAGDAAAAGTGRFAAAMATIKLGALVAVVTNLREIGTAIGEGVAKWAGYGKAIEAAEAAARGDEERTRDAAAAKAALSQQLQIAADRALGLNKESRKLVDEFEGLRLKGESVTEALSKLDKSLHLDNLDGIATAGAALGALGIRGQLSADQIRDAYTRALAGIDLGVFTAQARAAFGEGEQGAARLAAALDGALRESIRRAGGDFQLMSGGLSRAAQLGLNDLATFIDGLDGLKAAGIETGETLALSIGKAIDAADSEKALDAVRVQIERVRGVLGEKIASGFLDQAAGRADELRDRLDKALPSINSIREAYKQLGLQAPADLARIAEANRAAWQLLATDTSAGTDVLAQGFARYAQSALAASGQVGSASRAMTEELLRAEAAAKGLAVEFDKTGRLIVQGSTEAASAIDRTTRSIHRQTQALQDQQRVTSDGLKANADGSAAGTFGNVAPMDVAHEIMRKRDRGELTADDLADAQTALQQARNAQDWLSSMSPGAVSTEALQSTAALRRAAEDAVQRVTQMQGRAGRSEAGGGSYTVNVNVGGANTSLGMATRGDADALAGLLQQLDQARGVAAR